MAAINIKAEVLEESKSNSPTTGGGPIEMLLAVPRLVLLAIRLLFDSRVPATTKAALAGGMLYIISPIDLVPDMIPVLGQLEDMALALLLIDGMVNHVDGSIVAKHWSGRSATLRRIGRLTGGLTKILPKFIRRRVMRKTFSGRFNPAPAAGA